MTKKDKDYLDKAVDGLVEQSIRLDQSYRDGRTIVSTRFMSDLVKNLSNIVKVINRNVPITK